MKDLSTMTNCEAVYNAINAAVPKLQRALDYSKSVRVNTGEGVVLTRPKVDYALVESALSDIRPFVASGTQTA